jgi:hypothetical protein
MEKKSRFEVGLGLASLIVAVFAVAIGLTQNKPAWLPLALYVLAAALLAVLLVMFSWPWLAKLWNLVRRLTVRSPLVIRRSPVGELVAAAVAANAPSPPTPPLSYEEREEIQQIRMLYNAYFAPAIRQLQFIFGNLVYALEQQRYWGVLVEPKRNRLHNQNDTMEKAIRPDSAVRLSDVKEIFKQLYVSYFDAAIWTAMICEREPVDASRLPDWRVTHLKFAEKHHELVQRPELEDLNLSLSVFDNINALWTLLYPRQRAISPVEPGPSTEAAS